MLLGVPCAGLWGEDGLALKCYSCADEVSPARGLDDHGRRRRARPGGAGGRAGRGARPAGRAARGARGPVRRGAVGLLADASSPAACAATPAGRSARSATAPPASPRSTARSGSRSPSTAAGNTTWNVTRAMHLAGRCVGCDECARVCPADIRLDLLNRRVAQEVETPVRLPERRRPGRRPAPGHVPPGDPDEFIVVDGVAPQRRRAARTGSRRCSRDGRRRRRARRGGRADALPRGRLAARRSASTATARPAGLRRSSSSRAPRRSSPTACEGDDVALETPPASEEEQVLFGRAPLRRGRPRAPRRRCSSPTAPDSLYAARRARTATVSLACESARPECFCTAVGGSPAGADGSDLQLVLPLGEDVAPAAPDGEGSGAGRSGSGRLGAGLGRGPGPRRGGSGSPWRRAMRRQRGRAGEWASVLEGAFDASALGGSSASAASAAASARTSARAAAASTSRDEGSAFCGTRCRIWDSCTFAQFTRHASGHNPRSTQPARYRQRVLHKFAYFPLEHDGRFMCVGCGRCVKLCPVGSTSTRLRRARGRGRGGEADGEHGRERRSCPHLMRIAGAREETPDVRTLRLEFVERGGRLEPAAGGPASSASFTVFGAGESVFTIANPPSRPGTSSAPSRQLGKVTEALRGLSSGAGRRLPRALRQQLPGRGVAGQRPGLRRRRHRHGGRGGPAPVRPRPSATDFGDVVVLNGARRRSPTSSTRTRCDEWAADRRASGSSAPSTRAARRPAGTARSGCIPDVFERLGLEPEGRIVVVCGPPVMLHFMLLALEQARATRPIRWSPRSRTR